MKCPGGVGDDNSSLAPSLQIQFWSAAQASSLAACDSLLVSEAAGSSVAGTPDSAWRNTEQCLLGTPSVFIFSHLQEPRDGRSGGRNAFLECPAFRGRK